ncbi:MAG: dUTP diphosphatase [Saccharofermentanales bacterium]
MDYDQVPDEVEVKVSLCRADAKLPAYARQGDAGMDITAAEDVAIAPGETRLVPTGIKVAIPQGYELQVRPRSGISLNTPLRIPNSPGTIDSGFRDEIQILMTNTSAMIDSGGILAVDIGITAKGNQNGIYIISKGDRIAQLVLHKVPSVRWDLVDSVEKEGIDRFGGFGSTGVH